MAILIIKLRGAFCEPRKVTVVSIFAIINVTAENRPIEVGLIFVGGAAEINLILVDGVGETSPTLVSGVAEVSPALVGLIEAFRYCFCEKFR